jgi:hypothetical protein
MYEIYKIKTSKSTIITFGDINICFNMIIHIGHLDFIINNVSSEVPKLWNFLFSFYKFMKLP